MLAGTALHTSGSFSDLVCFVTVGWSSRVHVCGAPGGSRVRGNHSQSPGASASAHGAGALGKESPKLPQGTACFTLSGALCDCVTSEGQERAGFIR